MAFDTLKNVSIRGISCAVPDSIVSAEAYTDVLGKKGVEKFIESAGIHQRHIGDGSVIASDFCYYAAEDLLARLSVDRSEVDALILVTQSPDYTSPPTSCVLQHRLGLSEHCLAFDITMGCSGYIYGLHTAAALMQNGNIRNVLLLVGESQDATSEDRSQMMLFGEAGTATLLNYLESENVMLFQLKTLGNGFRNLLKPCGGFRHPEGERKRIDRGEGIIRSDFEYHMDGQEVFKFTISEVPKMFQEFHDHFNISIEDHDYFFLHQANKFMLEYLAKKSGFPKQKMPLSLDRYGNTSSASIPLTMCDFFNNDYSGPQNASALLSGFGIGLSLGVATIPIDAQRCFPIVTVSEGWDDALGDIMHRQTS